jgi:hypothetical protein
MIFQFFSTRLTDIFCWCTSLTSSIPQDERAQRLRFSSRKSFYWHPPSGFAGHVFLEAPDSDQRKNPIA